LSKPAILALADGSIFRGESIGADGSSVGEVVFNTAMTGYQEILTDPSYARQIVTLTYPHIGNTGVTPEDIESDAVQAAGLVIRDLPLLASNWRCKQTLDDYLRENGIVAIAGIDTAAAIATEPSMSARRVRFKSITIFLLVTSGDDWRSVTTRDISPLRRLSQMYELVRLCQAAFRLLHCIYRYQERMSISKISYETNLHRDNVER